MSAFDPGAASVVVGSVAPTTPAPKRSQSRGSLPGFGLSFGVTLTYLALIVLIPLAGLAWKTTSLSGRELVDAIL
ncbi:MAG: hypothetical protein QOI66_1373, partial [Myxococcales bacterium]|nr:hypothetical protein [Myxococcales bacterium]